MLSSPLKCVPFHTVSRIAMLVFVLSFVSVWCRWVAASEPVSVGGSETIHGKSISGAHMKAVSLPPGIDTVIGITNRRLSRDLMIQLLDASGKPIAGERVVFKVMITPGRTDDSQLTSETAMTDEQGIATVGFVPGAIAGKYVVSAFWDGHVYVNPVSFRIEARVPSWGIFLVFSLLGGLGIFLLGMNFSADGLKSAAGNRMRSVLSTLTGNRAMGLSMGVVATAMLQSSSASTVMLVGFVEAMAMTLKQSLAVILGAKIGTTITVQVIALDLSVYSLLLVAVGFLVRVSSSRKRVKHVGEVILGFGMIFFGMGVMGEAMMPLRAIPDVAEALLKLEAYPLFGILLATGFTAIIQSSAATIGLAVALCGSGLLPLEAALPLSFGAHIGTCATALLSSLGTGRAGKQVAIAHLLISVLGVSIAFPFMDLILDGGRWVSQIMGAASVARDLANAHMVFALITGLILLPFTAQLDSLVKRLLPVSTKVHAFRPTYLASSAQALPVLALELAQKEIYRMGSILRSMLVHSIDILENPEIDVVDKMEAEDDKIDLLEKAIRSYLATVAQGSLSQSLVAREHALIYITQDLEGIGDLVTKEIAHASRKLEKKHVSFSREGKDDLRLYHSVLMRKFDMVLDAIQYLDPAYAREVMTQNDEERTMERGLREAHLERLHQGYRQTVESSTWHLSALYNMRAISERMDNIARTILEELNY